MENLAPPRTKRQQEILTRAAALFDRRGYTETSMEDIAVATGIKKPTVYHHFESKVEILYLIHEEFISILLEREAQRAARQVSYMEALPSIMFDILELMKTHKGHVRVFFEHHRELSEAQKYDSLLAQRDAYFDTVVTYIRSGVSEGVFRRSDPHLSALAFFGMCNWAYTWFRPEGQLTPEDISRQFWQLFSNGITVRD